MANRQHYIVLTIYSGSQKSEVCPMPYALCPMPYALCPVVPHLSEKGYTNCLLYHLPIHNPPLSLLADQIVAHPQVFIARRNRLIAIEHFGFFCYLGIYLDAIGISRICRNSINLQLVYITLVSVVSLLSFCH